MGIKALSRIIWLFTGLVVVISQEDSLQSALNAVDHRQKYLVDYSGIPYKNLYDLNYLSDSSYDGPEGDDLRQDYTDEENEPERQFSSPFRERIKEDNHRQLEELAEKYLNKLRTEDAWNRYESMFKDKYRNYPDYKYEKYEKNYQNERPAKRTFYPQFGYDSIGLRKRYKYPRSEYSNYDNEEFNPDDNVFLPNEEKPQYLSKWYNLKHFPVNKRSSNTLENNIQHNKLGKTDPNVEKDLSDVFGMSDKVEDHKAKTNDKKDDKNNATATTKSPEPTTSKPQLEKEKPIQLSKKSIDWSDYFGLDRRKKSDKGLDKQWLIERYHKAMNLNEKRTPEPPTTEKNDVKVKKPKLPQDKELQQLNKKLMNMEEALVEDALKYTGAHEGEADTKEILEIKDRIISRLAQAYSLEKMRKALSEYRMNMESERERAKLDDDENITEKKRVAVPRKEAVDTEKSKEVENNNIKCVHGETDCEEEYKVPIEEVHTPHLDNGKCPKIQQRCNEITENYGPHATMFEDFCVFHQKCLLCGNNSWFAPTRQCNMLYLSYAFDYCSDDLKCRKEAQNLIRYSLDAHKSLRIESLDGCDLKCPDLEA